MSSEAPKKKKLTVKAEKYCRARVNGMSQRQAYKAAGYGTGKAKPTSMDHSACLLEKKEHIQARLAELSALADAGAIMESVHIQTALTETAIDQSKPDSVRLKAIDQLSRIKGLYSDSVKIESMHSVTIDDKRDYMRNLLQGNG